MPTNSWREYFYIPKKERWISFLFLIICNAIVCVVYLIFFSGENRIELTVLQPENVINEKESGSESIISNEKPKKIEVNKISLEDWMNLGFSKKQAKMILAFRYKIGGFKTSEDLLKVFCIDAEFVSRKDLFFDFEQRAKEKIKKKFDFKRNADLIADKNQNKESPLPNKKVNINRTNTSELIQLPGIGKVLSKRILKYRDLLGGFHDKQQIREVYGLSDENYQRFQDKIEIKGQPKKMDLNSADFKTLIRHPYLDKQHVNAILKYKEQHGKFQSLSQLKEIYSIPDSIFVKIRPYLKIGK